MVELIETESLLVVRLCFGDNLVIGIEEVLCEAAKHIHDPKPFVERCDGCQRCLLGLEMRSLWLWDASGLTLLRCGRSSLICSDCAVAQEVSSGLAIIKKGLEADEDSRTARRSGGQIESVVSPSCQGYMSFPGYSLEYCWISSLHDRSGVTRPGRMRRGKQSAQSPACPTATGCYAAYHRSPCKTLGLTLPSSG